MTVSKKTESGFTSQFGVIMAAVGSTVGLGNIWKFPYVAGENGGGTFLIVYLLCVILFGTPLLLTELIIGKRARSSVYGAYSTLGKQKGWRALGYLGVTTAIVMNSYYFVVTGWCLEYFFLALKNAFEGLDTAALNTQFDTFIGCPWLPIILSAASLMVTAGILWFGVSKGIERLSRILTPMLFLILIILAINILMVDGSSIGLKFFFQPDFSKLTPHTVLDAMTQCFFSLSVGLGCLVTYGAYMPEKQKILNTAGQIIALDTLVAIIAGIVIFPAVFAFGFNPAEGTQLVFVVMPAIFQNITFGYITGILFFLLLFIAALTSTISMMEVAIAFITEASATRKKPIHRRGAILIVSAIMIALFIPCSLSMTGLYDGLVIDGKTLFYWYDLVNVKVLMPCGAIALTLFIGWFVDRKASEQAILMHRQEDKTWYTRLFFFLVRFFVPLIIILIFLNEFGIIHI